MQPMKSIDYQPEITRFIREQLLGDLPGIPLTPESDLLSENLLDSMGIMRLVSFIDDQFQIAVPAADVTIENFLTIQDICDYLATLSQSQNTE